jgi:hypothetical protein
MAPQATLHEAQRARNLRIEIVLVYRLSPPAGERLGEASRPSR